MSDREITWDYLPHVVGEREVVDWSRPDGKTYRDVPIVYLREVTAEEYYEAHPAMRHVTDPGRRYFWEVSVD